MFSFFHKIASRIQQIVRPQPAQPHPTTQEVVSVEEVRDQLVSPPVRQPDVETVRPKAPKIPLAKLTHGWYFDKDIESWRRRSKETGGDWPPAGRRLRTLLIRMVARGHFGPEMVPMDRLWMNLPSPFEEEMRRNIERLIERSLLLENSQAEQDSRLVSLNPDMVAEIQNLINRTVSPFWADIVGEQKTVVTSGQVEKSLNSSRVNGQ